MNTRGHRSSTITSGYKVVKKEQSDVSSEISTDITNSENVQENKRFQSIVNTDYVKSNKGSLQDNMTKEQIKSKLVGYKSLKTPESKRYLLSLPLFKTWIKYYNPTTKQFRTGGLLMKVDKNMRFIVLVNTTKNLSWSVQLQDNIIFVPDPDHTNANEEEQTKECETKEKLYNLYKQGRLKKV